ncbi:tetratricopeptide repeat protein [Fundidesulfovibrio agrisoli]|uniref:tetratricopeptide repeat protein n=1 Tax=Fundidesulfovibrio agrisoli TaxID=2922717 RepID=UPI001FABAE9D|nr:tetratricopeptide repeat protein [Fundidesulfovibrio agrisoli]
MEDIKYYDAFISLGLNCEVSSKIRKFCHSYSSSFFGWASVFTLKSLVKCLSTGMNLLTEQSEPNGRDFFMYPDFGVAFHGRVQFATLGNLNEDTRAKRIQCADDELISRQAYLWMKFLNLKNSGKKVLFILKFPKEKIADKIYSANELYSDLLELYSTLCHVLPELNFDLLLITDSGSFPLLSDSEHIFHRETILAPSSDALTNSNNKNWSDDIFKEFKVVNDTKFTTLVGLFSDKTTVSFNDYFLLNEFKTIDSNREHLDSSFLRVVSQFDRDLAIRFAHSVLESNLSMSADFYADAAGIVRSTNVLLASQFLEKAIEIDRNIPMFHVNYSQLLVELDKIEAAIAEVLLALDLDPNNPHTLHHLAGIYRKLKSYVLAEDCYKKAIFLNAGVASFHVNYSHLLNELGRVDEAIAEVMLALDIDPANPHIINHMANIHRRVKDYTLSEVYYKKAIELSPGCVDFYINYSQLLNIQGKIYDAIDEALLALKLNSGNARNQHYTGTLFQKVKNFCEAENCYNRALQIDSDNQDYYISSYLLLFEQGKTHEAISIALLALDLGPGNPHVHHHLGNFYRNVKDFVSAEASYIKAISIYPNDFNFHASYSHLLSEQGKPLRAISEVLAALKIVPEHPYLLHHLGNLYFKVSEFELAEEYYKKAISVLPDDYDFRLSYINLLMHRGKMHEATEEALIALNFSPDNPQVICQLTKLKDEQSFHSRFKRMLKSCANVLLGTFRTS